MKRLCQREQNKVCYICELSNLIIILLWQFGTSLYRSWIKPKGDGSCGSGEPQEPSPFGLQDNYSMETTQGTNVFFFNSIRQGGLFAFGFGIISRQSGEAVHLWQIVERFKETTRIHEFTDADIENLITRKYGQSDTLVVMSILFPWADLSNLFQLDRIHPKSAFTPNRLRRKGIDADKQRAFLDNNNYIGNLQLLEGLDNSIKKDRGFLREWYEETLPTDDERGLVSNPNTPMYGTMVRV